MPSQESKSIDFKSHWLDSTRIRTSEIQTPRFPKTGEGRSTRSVIPSGRVDLKIFDVKMCKQNNGDMK